MAALDALTAACGSSGKVAAVNRSSGGPSVKAQTTRPAAHGQLQGQYLRFADCMRSHEISDFPDPLAGRGGHPGFRLQGGPGSDLNSNSPAFQRAIGACQQILGHDFRFAFKPSGAGKGA
jgi:hypothetical protein